MEPHDSTRLVSFRPLALLGALGVLAVVWVIGFYFLVALVPVAVAAMVMALALPRRLRPFLWSFSIQAGLMLTLMVSVLLASASFAAVAFDLLLITALLVWLFLRPGTAPVVLLVILNGLSLLALGVNLISFWGVTMVAKSLLVHVVLRAAAIAVMIREFLAWRKAKRTPSVWADSPTS